MNKLKKIYYPILAVLLIALIVFSAISVKVNLSTPFISTSLARTNAEKIATAGNYDITDDLTSSSSSSDRYNVVSTINTITKDALKKYKTLYNSKGTSKTYVSGATSSNTDILLGQYVELDENEKEVKMYELAPAYYSTRITVDQADMDAIPNAKEKGFAKGMVFQNVLLYIPGTQTKSAITRSELANDFSFEIDEKKLADAVMMVAHYDSNVGDNGYTNNSATIGTMLALLDKIVNGEKSYKNDILMVFTDASYHNGLGLEFLMNSPEYTKIFSGVMGRVKSVAIFDNVGGVSTIVASQAKGSDTVSLFATAGDWYHSGSFSGDIASQNIGGKEFNAISGVSAIEILGLGNKSEITTKEALTDEVMGRIATVIGSFADKFGDAKLGALDNDAIVGYYSYVGLNFWFASYIAYIIGAIILALIGLIVWYLIIKKKAINPVKIGYGSAVSVLSVIATVATVTILYLLVVLILSLFGTVSLYAIGSIATDSVVFFIIALVVSLVLLALYNVLFKNVFKAKVLDVVKGNAWVVTFVALVACFAFPTYSYLFAGLAIAQCTVMLCSAIFKDKFKEKFGFDIERLALYGASAIILLPVVFAEALVVYSVSPAIFLPLVLSLVLVYAQSIVPYILIIKDLLGIESKKVAQETTEAPVKPALVSKNAIAFTSIFTVVAYACVLLVSVFTASNNGLVATQSTFCGKDAIYNNSFVYEYNDLNGKTSQSIFIKDLDLYTYMKNDLGDFKWDIQRNAYVLGDSTDASYLPIENDEYTPYYKISGEKTFKFNTGNLGKDIRLGDKSALTITFKTVKSADKISSVKLFADVTKTTSYEEFEVNGDEITLTVPAGYGSDLAVEVLAKSGDSYVPVVELNVKVSTIYVTGTLDKMGDLTGVFLKNDTMASLNSKYSNSEILNNIYSVFEYNYEGKDSIPQTK